VAYLLWHECISRTCIEVKQGSTPLASQKRLVCLTKLAYASFVKMLDRNTDAASVHIPDDPNA
jgi:hypothetical protein